MKRKKYIVCLGCSGFPYGFAEVQKMILISKGLLETGNSVTVINTKGTHSQADYPDLTVSGNYEGIDFVCTSKFPFRHSNFVKRNLLKIYGIINEFLLLKNLKKQNKLDYAILSTNSFYSILYYVFLSKLFGFKTILNYVEYFSRIKRKWYMVGLKINDKLYDKHSPLLVDAVFPISEFLINHVKKIAPDQKYLKIPIMTDLEKFTDCDTQQDVRYFLFCGYASYKEIVKFIIDSFGQLNSNSIYLYLVINGDDKDISEIKDYILNSLQRDRIRLFSRLTDRQLHSYYKNAIGLLIPLRPTFEDKARFPHKIGEYLASGNPVVSTNYGEVKHYFKDMENMLIADSYSVNLFACKMQFVMDNPEEAVSIGRNGKNMALRIFDYRYQGQNMNSFINQNL